MEAFEGVRVLPLEESDAEWKEIPELRVVDLVEVQDLVAHAEFLSTLTGDRAFRSWSREIVRDHGEALLFAARLWESGNPEPAVKLATFYLKTYGTETMEEEVGAALHGVRYQEILHTFEQNGDIRRFVNSVKSLLEDGIPRLRAIPPKMRGNAENPFGGGDPFGDPFGNDPFGRFGAAALPEPVPEPAPDPFAGLGGFGGFGAEALPEPMPEPAPDPFGGFGEPPPPDPALLPPGQDGEPSAEDSRIPFVPQQDWWCASEIGSHLEKWRSMGLGEEGKPPFLIDFPAEKAHQHFYRNWYHRRPELLEIGHLLRNDFWLLLPDALVRKEILAAHYQNRYRYREDPAFRQQVEQQITTARELLQDRDSLLMSLPIFLQDLRPIPGTAQLIRKRAPAVGGEYLTQIEVPRTLAELVPDLMGSLSMVDRYSVNLKLRPSEKNALTLQKWIQTFASNDASERAWFFSGSHWERNSRGSLVHLAGGSRPSYEETSG